MGINKNDIVKHEQMTTSEKRHRRFSISSSSFTFYKIIVQKEIVSFVATKKVLLINSIQKAKDTKHTQFKKLLT